MSNKTNFGECFICVWKRKKITTPHGWKDQKFHKPAEIEEYRQSAVYREAASKANATAAVDEEAGAASAAGKAAVAADE